MPSFPLDTTSANTSKVHSQSQSNTMKSMMDSKIYVQRSFDVTELDVLQNGNERETPRTGDGTKQSEAAWTEVSRGSSQEALVRESTPVGAE
jgi:hypothetical protein